MARVFRKERSLALCSPITTLTERRLRKRANVHLDPLIELSNNAQCPEGCDPLIYLKEICKTLQNTHQNANFHTMFSFKIKATKCKSHNTQDVYIHLDIYSYIYGTLPLKIEQTFPFNVIS